MPGVTLASPAFYQTGTAAQPSVQPQFVIGPSAWYSRRLVARGPGAMLLGAGRLRWPGRAGVGLLTSAVVGPRWGPLGAFAHRHLLPLLHVDRSPTPSPSRCSCSPPGSAGARRRQRPRCAGARAARPGARLRRRGAHRRRGADPRRRPARDGAAAAGGCPDDDPPRRGGRPRCSGGRGRHRGLGPGGASGCPASTSAASPARSSRCGAGVVLASAAGAVLVLARRGVRMPGALRRRLARCAPGWCCWPASCWRAARCGRSCASPPPTPARASSRASSAAGAAGGRRPHLRRADAWGGSAWWVGPVAVAIACVGGGGRSRTGWPPCLGRRRGCRRGPARFLVGLGVGAAHLCPAGHHPRPPVGRPAPVHRPAGRDRRRGDGGRVADPLVHPTDATGCPWSPAWARRRCCSCPSGLATLPARRASGSSPASGRPPRLSAGACGPATWR